MKRYLSIVLHALARWLVSVPVTRFWYELLLMFACRRFDYSPIKPPHIRRLLVVRLDEIGDAVLNSLFLRELRRNCPDARITLVVQPKVYGIVELCPYVNEILTFCGKRTRRRGALMNHFSAWQFARKHLWPRRFDVVVIPNWDFDISYASFIAYFSGAKQVCAYTEKATPWKARVNNSYNRLFTHINDEVSLRHEVQCNAGMVTFLGGKVNDDSVEMWLDDSDNDFAASCVPHAPAGQQSRVIGIGLGSGALKKCWPKERFFEIISWLLDKSNATILLVGNSSEADLGIFVTTRLGENRDRIVNIMGLATLRQTAACLGRCRLYVGNDTGLMHIAAAMKVPVVEISSWSPACSSLSIHSPVRFGPWKVPHVVVAPLTPCPPCRHDCESLFPHCILQVSVDEVKKAVSTLMSSEVKFFITP